MADDLAGSPRHAQCTTTASQRPAVKTIARLGRGRTTTSGDGLESRVSGPMPLFLIPHVVAGEVRKHRDAVVEVRVLRTGGHTYLMQVWLGPEKQQSNGTAAERGGPTGQKAAAHACPIVSLFPGAP